MRSRRQPLLAALVAAAFAPWAAGQVEGPQTGVHEVVGTAAAVALVRESALGFVTRAARAEDEGRHLEAASLYHRALFLDATLLAAHLGYARCLAARGQHDEAVASLDALRTEGLDDPEAVTLAQALGSLGAHDHAIALLRARPGREITQRALTELCAAAGRFAEALAAARAWQETTAEGGAAGLWVRALERLVAEADAVRRPDVSGERVSALRRVLAMSPRP